MGQKIDEEFVQEVWDEYGKISLIEFIGVINELDNAGDFRKSGVLKESFAIQLKLVPESKFIKTCETIIDLELLTKDMEQQLSELRENFRRHRHEFSKKYSEKPSW